MAKLNTSPKMTLQHSTNPGEEEFVLLKCECGWDSRVLLHPVRVEYWANFHRELDHSH